MPVKKSAALKKAQASGVKVDGKTYANTKSNKALADAKAAGKKAAEKKTATSDKKNTPTKTTSGSGVTITNKTNRNLATDPYNTTGVSTTAVRTSPTKITYTPKGSTKPVTITTTEPDAVKYNLEKSGANIVEPEATIPDQTFDQGLPQVLTPLGDMNIKTGDPKLDKIYDDYLSLLEAQFSSDPMAIFNDQAFSKYKEAVDKAWGPLFKTELDLAQQAYNLKKTGIESESERMQRDLSQKLSRGLEDYGTSTTRTLEDTKIGKERIARSLSEAKQESAMAMANRGLTFGGSRKKEASQLESKATESTSDLEKTSRRTLEDLTTEKSRLETDIPYEKQFYEGQSGRSLSELEAQLTQQKRELEGERQLQYEKELQRLTNIGSSVLSNQNKY